MLLDTLGLLGRSWTFLNVLCVVIAVSTVVAVSAIVAVSAVVAVPAIAVSAVAASGR